MKRSTSNYGNRLLIVLVLACIVLFSGLGYMILSGRDEGNIVGVIHIEGAITSSQKIGEISVAINNAITDSSIKGVVLKIDSPGGYAHLVEQIYLDILELKHKKPVVASLVTALSGGYYIAASADYIYTAPSSMVGNVGVIGFAPENLLPSELTFESGPYKASGFSKLLFPFNLSHAVDNFVAAVEDGRGSKLTISSSELKKGMIYLGSEAVNAGLADEVGALQRALEHVAKTAGISTYKVMDIFVEEEAEAGVSTSANATQLNWRKMTVTALNEMNPPPAIYYIYLPPEAYQLNQEDALITTVQNGILPTDAYGKGQVVVDLSHGNQVSPWTFHLLSAELSMRGVYMGYAETWDDVESALDSASCLVVAAPTTSYSKDEWDTIEEFLNKGRILLLFSDPTIEFTKVPELLGPVNSIANRYGLTFGKGYLYELDDYYGIYRNIYVGEFANTSITTGLERLVLFTSTYLHSTDSDAAWTTPDTYSSISERAKVYAPISVITKGNGTICAFGDITFLMEPWSYVDDNYRLVMNIVSTITEIDVPIIEEPEEPVHNITKAEIPVGTVKLFTENVDGDVRDVRWLKTGEREVQVERENRTTVYTLDENDGVLGWVQGDMSMVYDEPVPDLPYPLIQGKAWTFRIGYMLTMEGIEGPGYVTSNGRVVDFEEVETTSGDRYFCAKLYITESEDFSRPTGNMTISSIEYIWMSQEIGFVKGSTELKFYVDDELVKEESRDILLVSVSVEN
jgi:protease-4